MRLPKELLLDSLEIDDEDERLVWLDRWRGASSAIAERGRDDDLATTADLHADNPLPEPRHDCA